MSINTTIIDYASFRQDIGLCVFN